MITNIFKKLEPSFFTDERSNKRYPRVAVSCGSIEETKDVAKFFDLPSNYIMHSSEKRSSIGRHDNMENYMLTSELYTEDPNFISKHKAIHISYEVFALNKDSLVEAMSDLELYKKLGMEGQDDSALSEEES